MDTVTVALTLTEITPLLDPPMSEKQLRLIVQALRIQPAGARRNGHPGRPADLYNAADLFRLHAALAPWLTT